MSIVKKKEWVAVCRSGIRPSRWSGRRRTGFLWRSVAGTSLILLTSSTRLLAKAPIQVDITRMADRVNLGVSPARPSEPSSRKLTERFQLTLNNDLIFSKLFHLMLDGPEITRRTNVKSWAPLGAEVVWAGRVRGRKRDVRVTSTLYDVKAAKPVLTIKKKRSLPDVEGLAHEVANEIVEYFSGQPGIFTSHIAFVNNATQRKELYIANYDGSNLKRVTNDNSIVILPRISPDGKKIVFTSYRSGNPDLYLIDRDGKGRRRLSSNAGLNVSPSWAPDGKELAITLSVHGPPNIYLMDLSGKILRRLTKSLGADVAPAFSPDGTQIAFTSDREGSPQIYIMNLEGSGLRRITTDGHCDSAAWSPDGQTIVFVKGRPPEKYDIYSVEVLTGIERRLTWGEGNNENPAWSPDGRFILFTSSRRDKNELYVMSWDGEDPHPLNIPKGESFTPHWSN